MVWKGGFHAHVYSSNHTSLLMHMRIDAMKVAAARVVAFWLHETTVLTAENLLVFFC